MFIVVAELVDETPVESAIVSTTSGPAGVLVDKGAETLDGNTADVLLATPDRIEVPQ